jgi:hypothetical protein
MLRMMVDDIYLAISLSSVSVCPVPCLFGSRDGVAWFHQTLRLRRGNDLFVPGLYPSSNVWGVRRAS